MTTMATMAGEPINDTDRRVLNCFYTQHGTKLFVENGVLVEQKINSLTSSSVVLLDPNLRSVTSPVVGGFTRPVDNPIYSSHPPPPTKPLSSAEIKKISYQRSIMTAQEALAYYNVKHPKKYELVRPIESNVFKSNGFWFHCVFLAKPMEDVGDSTERCFFAELKANGVKLGKAVYLVTFCRPIDGTQTTLGCEICDWMPHPLSGFVTGNPQVQPPVLRSSTRSSRVQEKELASASGSPYAKDSFCLKIEDLHKYIPNSDALENDWMQYM